ncbi:MAG TPA: ribosomal protein S18-alanine N-acetyltransferase [Burkholderiaceae bacterium]|nr:ribosomal protein S18-alanine N-acetyltransferase [Burkholderiaceae bacterium]
MVAVPRTKLRFMPMSMESLDAVMAIEVVAYPFPWTRVNFADSLKSGYSAWLMFEDTTLVGYGVFMLALDDAHLLNLTIDPMLHSRGYGAVMLAELMRLAKSHGAARIFLEVRPSNGAARRLYDRTGFKTVGIRRGYYPDHHERREDAIVMERTL